MPNPPLPGDQGANFIGQARTVTKTASATLAVYEQLVLAVPQSGNTTYTLPNVVEAAGRIYSIWSYGNAAGTITVQDQDETPVPYTSSALTADKDRVVVYSDGYQWYQLFIVAT